VVSTARQPRQISVVIPAHNEASVLGACLAALQRAERDADGALAVEVVVVTNGCTDDTAEVARGYGVRVVELAEGDKSKALNAGDAASTVFPRLYLDADIVLSPGTVAALAEALSTPAAVLAAPAARYETTGASWTSRAFHRVFAELPYATESLGGVGVYGVSQSGRARWAQFPQVRGDDLFAQRHFAPQERIRVPGYATVRVPRTTGALLAVRTRVAAGNTELARGAAGDQAPDTSASTLDTLRALGRLVGTNPRLLGPTMVYLAVILEARRRARGAGGPAWHRDGSTR